MLGGRLGDSCVVALNWWGSYHSVWVVYFLQDVLFDENVCENNQDDRTVSANPITPF